MDSSRLLLLVLIVPACQDAIQASVMGPVPSSGTGETVENPLSMTSGESEERGQPAEPHSKASSSGNDPDETDEMDEPDDPIVPAYPVPPHGRARCPFGSEPTVISEYTRSLFGTGPSDVALMQDDLGIHVLGAKENLDVPLAIANDCIATASAIECSGDRWWTMPINGDAPRDQPFLAGQIAAFADHIFTIDFERGVALLRPWPATEFKLLTELADYGYGGSSNGLAPNVDAGITKLVANSTTVAVAPRSTADQTPVLLINAMDGSIVEGPTVNVMYDLDMDEHHVYWTSASGFYRYDLESGSTEPFRTRGGYPHGMGLSPNYAYWAQDELHGNFYAGEVLRARKDGSSPPEVVGRHEGGAFALEVSDNCVFWLADDRLQVAGR